MTSPIVIPRDGYGLSMSYRKFGTPMDRFENIHPNSILSGIVPGTPGTLPTTWGVVAGLPSRTIFPVYIKNGVPTVRINFSGIATLTFNQLTISDSVLANRIKVDPDTYYNSSIYFSIPKLDPTLGLGAFTRQHFDVGGGFINTANTILYNPANPNAGQWRDYGRSAVSAKTPINAENIIELIIFSGFTVGQPYDYDIEVGLTMTERARFTGPPMLTT